MLYRFSVKELKAGNLTRRFAYLVVVMQYYPRFLPKSSIDEYLRSLSPSRELFSEFKALDRTSKFHDEAFEKVSYESRFWLNNEGLADLERLSILSRQRDVHLLCQCASTEKCHADLLLLMAKRLFSAHTSLLRNKYPIFEKRLNGDS